MGVDFTPIIPRQRLELHQLRGRSFALDASIELYQFLALIRKPDGEPLRDSRGRVTSHLVGLLFRSTRLLDEYGMRLIYVFDGEPHPLKGEVLRRRREARRRAYEEWRRLLTAGELRRAWSKAVVSSTLTHEIIQDAKTLLGLMGIPYVDAPSDAEAQAAYYCGTGAVWACGSKDYDSILFGADRLVRYLTIQGSEYMPSKGLFRSLKPELVDAKRVSTLLGLGREQLVDVAILMGTDYNRGVFGIGPKRALELIRHFGSIENLPSHIRARVDPNFEEVRRVFLHPRVSETPPPPFKSPDERGILDFLVNERGFSRERVMTAIERLRRVQVSLAQEPLSKYV